MSRELLLVILAPLLRFRLYCRYFGIIEVETVPVVVIPVWSWLL